MALLIAVIYFVVVIIGAGLYTRKKIRSASDFNLASQNMGWVMVTFAFVLTPLGSGHSIGLWEQAIGPLGAGTLWWGIGAGAVFLPIMMLWLGPLARKTGCVTFPEISRNLYGRGMGWLHACITIGSMSGLCAAEMIASGAAIYALSDGAIPLFPWCIVIAFIFTVLYVLFGGLLQMAWVNFVNAIVMIAGSFVAMIMIALWAGNNYTYSGETGMAAIQLFYKGTAGALKLTQFDLGNMGIWLGLILPVILLHLTAGGVSQPHNLPFFAAKSDQECRKGVFIGALINSLAAVPWVAIALIGLAIPAVVKAGGDNLGKLIVPITAFQTLPKPIVGVLMISLLSATLSTAGAIVMGNSHLFVNDILKGALFPKLGGKNEILAGRIAIIASALICFIPALSLPVIMPVFFWCFTFSMPVFVIYIMGMYVRINKVSAWITTIVAYVVAFIWTFMAPENIPFPFNITMYPVLIVSIVCGIILPFLIKGGRPPMSKQVDFNGTDIFARAKG